MKLPEAFASNMKLWLGQEWSDLESALFLNPLRAVRLHRVRASIPDGYPAEPSYSANRSANSHDRDASWYALTDEPLPAPPAIAFELRDPVPWMPDAYYIDTDSPLGKSIYHDTGAYYIQEPSAMAVVSALRPVPGERILDLCAAPGGKTTAIARAMCGEGLLVANEIHPSRASVLLQNMERTGSPGVVTNESPDRLAAYWPGQFDAVLVDAPCSGEGMFRKSHTAITEWTPEAPAVCSARQREILQQAVHMVRPGGRIVYSTCTLNPIENEAVALWFTEQFPVSLVDLPLWSGWQPGRPEWAGDRLELTRTRRLWPHVGRGEGHFIAIFEVQESVAEKENMLSRMKRRAEAPTPDWTSWLGQWVSTSHLLPGIQHPVLWGQRIFADETGGLPLDGLKVLRPGVMLAHAERGRLEPDHQLAMAVAHDRPLHAFELTESDAGRYIAGESLDQAPSHGWNWMHLGGLPLGWGKSVPGRTNNLYPKGLRRSDARP